MAQVALPETVYEEAVRAAAALGLSVEEFVAEAIHIHAHDDHEEGTLLLGPEQKVGVQRGLADVRAGRIVTLPDFDARFDDRRAAWLRANPHGR